MFVEGNPRNYKPFFFYSITNAQTTLFLSAMLKSLKPKNLEPGTKSQASASFLPIPIKSAFDHQLTCLLHLRNPQIYTEQQKRVYVEI